MCYGVKSVNQVKPTETWGTSIWELDEEIDNSVHSYDYKYTFRGLVT